MTLGLAKNIKGLCTPSYIYFGISIIVLLIIALQNLGNTNTYCVGMHQCSVPNTFGIFISKIVYIIFWTWILNTLCKAGYINLSWFLVLLPIILMFVMIAALLVAQTGNINI